MEHANNIPAEWAKHKAIWTCWPSAADLWGDDLESARAEVKAMVEALITPQNGGRDFVKLLVSGNAALKSAQFAFGQSVEIIEIPFGDVWLRDTGPIFAKCKSGKSLALCFGFNGWGGKYILDNDDSVNVKLSVAAGVDHKLIDFVLEGGSIDGNGQGVFLTTTQCLLNPNRNPNLTKPEIEKLLSESLGAEQILWLEDGLLNDHTDGHIDNIARFIGKNKIICQSAFGDDDPNAIILDKIYADLCSMTDLHGNNFEIIRAPSPGRVLNPEGDIVPASHMNFIIGNGTVVMPHYSTPSVDEALRVLADCFPSHKIIGIDATAILTGGGSFHCITQQEPE